MKSMISKIGVAIVILALLQVSCNEESGVKKNLC